MRVNPAAPLGDNTKFNYFSGSAFVAYLHLYHLWTLIHKRCLRSKVPFSWSLNVLRYITTNFWIFALLRKSPFLEYLQVNLVLYIYLRFFFPPPLHFIFAVKKNWRLITSLAVLWDTHLQVHTVLLFTWASLALQVFSTSHIYICKCPSTTQ